MTAHTSNSNSMRVWTKLNYFLVVISILGGWLLFTWTGAFWRIIPGALLGCLLCAYLFAGPLCVLLCPALMFMSGKTHAQGGTVFFGMNTLGFFGGLGAVWAWRNLHDLFGASC